MARRWVLTLLYCSVSPIPFATMTNREWGQIGNNYLKALFAIGFQGFLIMVCVGIYAVLVNSMIIADNLHSAIFSLAASRRDCGGDEVEEPDAFKSGGTFGGSDESQLLFFSRIGI